MQHPVVLVDSEAWVEPLVQALAARDLAPQVVNVRTFMWDGHVPFDGWELVVNRVSARPEANDVHPSMLLRKTQDLLAALNLAGVPCVHGSRAYAVGSSKVLQAQCFRQVGLRTPATSLVTEFDLDKVVAEFDSEKWLLKPNPGAFGTAIGAIGSPESVGAFALDGLAVVQERILPSEPYVYRAEFVDSQLAYLAKSPLLENGSNYCLAGAGAEVSLSRDMPADLRARCAKLFALTEIRMGSVEYLIDKSGEPAFIDINPVSSPHPDAKAQLGVDLWAMHAELVVKAWEQRATAHQTQQSG